MSFTDLPPEILTMIVGLIPRRRDLGAWRRTCKQNKNVLQQYRESMATIGANKFDDYSPDVFLGWMRTAPRTDDVIIDQSYELFHLEYSFKCDCRSLCETQVKKRNATLVLRHVRDHIGHERFMDHFETSVQYGSAWAMDVVSALARNHTDDRDDEVGKDHELALRLGGSALETLFRDRRLYQDEVAQSRIEVEIKKWTTEHEANLLKSNTLAVAKSMLDQVIAQEVHDEPVQVLASTSR